jgi:hypothetical protein
VVLRNTASDPCINLRFISAWLTCMVPPSCIVSQREYGRMRAELEEAQKEAKRLQVKFNTLLL